MHRSVLKQANPTALGREGRRGAARAGGPRHHWYNPIPMPLAGRPHGMRCDLVHLLLLLVTHSAGAQMQVEVDSPDGKLRCALVGTNTRQCLGVPFAAPPIGDNRWRAPQAVQPWSGVRSALEPQGGCVQDNWRAGKPKGVSATEDCLYLNVFSPRMPSPDKRGYPVVLWIHGGGYSSGDMSQANGTYWVDTFGDVVYVSTNYRLNVCLHVASTPDD
jgi:hypothetical protein